MCNDVQNVIVLLKKTFFLLVFLVLFMSAGQMGGGQNFEKKTNGTKKKSNNNIAFLIQARPEDVHVGTFLLRESIVTKNSVFKRAELSIQHFLWWFL